jgi:murein DD-endopeptidase MepM/ murein hydrolase activator NlpD
MEGMFEIEINISRPIATAITLAGIVGVFVWVQVQHDSTLHASGGSGDSAQSVTEIENTMRDLRREQAVLEHKEEILRYQMESLEHARVQFGEEYQEEFEQSREALLILLTDQKTAEESIRISLRQLQQAEGIASTFARGVMPTSMSLEWPLNPRYEISASFHDEEYEKRFGLVHEAIDIPALQGTIVRSTANGIVKSVTDNGLGFNSIVIEHDGFVTLYGHISAFLVHEGQTVRAGTPIALSGGMPGTPGAGHLTTGPHLHFELIAGGEHLDPLKYLPEWE